MAIDREAVEKVALLSRLILSDSELVSMTDQLGQIVGYVDQLSEVDTEGVLPMAHAVEMSNVLRADECQPGLPRGEALANAPRKSRDGYLVPAVLGD